VRPPPRSGVHGLGCAALLGVACAGLAPRGAVAQDPTGGPGATGLVEGVRVESTERRYELDEANLSGVIERLNGMRLEGPSGPPSQGLTQYRIDPFWRPAAGGGLCRVADLVLEVRVVVTLPLWPNARWASEPERADWEGILDAIRSHEYRHRDLTIEAARELHETLSALEARGCTALRQTFAGIVSIAGARLDDAHAELDRSTPTRLIRGGRGGAPRR